jgi:hypothetical protein
MDSAVLISYPLSICNSSCLKALSHLTPSYFGFQVQPKKRLAEDAENRKHNETERLFLKGSLTYQ